MGNLIKKATWLLFTILFLFILTPYTRLASAQAAGAEWPMFRRNLQHTGFNDSETVLKPPLTLKWYFQADSAVGSPSVAGNTVFFKSSKGTLYALESTTGNPRWIQQTQAATAFGPTVLGNTVYDGNPCENCTLDAFDSQTGSLKWSTPFLHGIGDPAVVNGVVYAGGSRITVALDALTGGLIWSTPVIDGVVGVPAVVDGRVFFGTSNSTFYALDATTGIILWTYELSRWGHVIASSPAVVDGTVYFGTGDAQVLALDAATGALKWAFGPTEDSVWGSPAIANGIVYIQALAGKIYALDANTGGLIWAYQTGALPSSSFSSPAVANGVVYIGSTDNYLYALDANTGYLLWRYQTGGSVVASPAVVGGMVFFGSGDGKMYTFESAAPPVDITGPVNIWVGLRNSDDVGIRFDLRAEVYRNGNELAAEGELESAPGGSSGFNNARQHKIYLTKTSANFLPGDTISLKLFVRNACSGSGKNSGGARLWHNGTDANSRFDATVGIPKTYYLLSAFGLGTSVGVSRQFIDVDSGSKCSPYKTWGTWGNITVP